MCISLVSFTCSAPSGAYNTKLNITRINSLIKQKQLLDDKNLKRRKKIKLSALALKLAIRESGSDWTLVNSIGAIGKYQFMPITLKTLGYNFSTAEFIEDPYIFPEEEQDYAMMRLLKLNRSILKPYFNLIGKTIYGYEISESGLLGAAHLAGAGNVIKFLKTGYNPSDKYGTRLTDYLLAFK